MRIIDNLNGRSHWAALVENTRRATHVTIVSPFIDDILVRLLQEATGSDLRSVTIVTRIYDTPSDAHASAARLLRVFDWADAHQAVSVEVHENPQLHGKIYLAKSGDTFTYGLLGSANCTNNGLIRNHEWSVEITDTPTLDVLWRDVENSLPRTIPLARPDLQRIAVQAKKAVEKNREALRAIKALRLRLDELLPERRRRVTATVTAPQGATGVVWLKPVGDSKNRISAIDDYWSDSHQLHFARRPVSVKVGDLVIAYATGWKKIVGLFEIVGAWRPQTAAELAAWPEGKRWPWCAAARPLTPIFARNWFAENLLLEDLVASFGQLSVPDNERKKTAKVIPAIRARSDKVKLTPIFAQYIIDELQRRDMIV